MAPPPPPPPPNDSVPLTLGETLRHEREKRGITIEQVASATKINVKALHALESNHYHELPAAPFVRGFVAAYARFIGINPNDLLTEFKDFIQERSKSDRVKKDAGHTGYAFERKETDDHRRNLWISIGSFLGVLIIAFLVFKPQLKRKHRHADKLREAHGGIDPTTGSPYPSPESSESEPAVIPPMPSPLVSAPSPIATFSAITPASPIASPSVVPSPSPKLNPSPTTQPSPIPSAIKPSPSASVSPIPSPSASVNLDPYNSGKSLPLSEVKHRIAFKAKEKTWVRYQVDDRPVTKFILKKGGTLFLRAKVGATVQFGNPDVVTFSFDGGASRPFAETSGAFERAGNLTMRYQSNSVTESEVEIDAKDALPRIEPIQPATSPTTSPEIP